MAQKKIKKTKNDRPRVEILKYNKKNTEKPEQPRNTHKIDVWRN